MKRVHSYNKKFSGGVDYSSTFEDEGQAIKDIPKPKPTPMKPAEIIAQHKRIIKSKEKTSRDEGGIYNPPTRDKEIIKGVRKKFKIK